MNLMRKFFVLAVMGIALAQMACQSGEVKTEHGFRFINHTNKSGEKPKVGETVAVNTYTYIGDSLFASTIRNFGGPREYTIPEPDKLPERIPPLYDAVLLMTEGDSATIYEKIDSFIMRFLPESMHNEKEVRYEVVVVDIKTTAEKQKAQEEMNARFTAVGAEVGTTIQDFKAGKLNDRLQSFPSGLKMLITDPGANGAITQGFNVRTHYYGALMDGTMFDNSFQRGQPLTFPAGQGRMIPGFDEGVMQLQRGGKAYLFIPYALGYGEQGSGPIPPKSDLVFYIEIQ